MARIFPEYNRSSVYAVMGAVLHFSLLTLVFFLEFMGQGGENPLSWLVAFWDLPIWVLNSFVQLPIFFSGKFTMLIGGTFLAAVEGWIVGAVVDAFLGWRLKKWGF